MIIEVSNDELGSRLDKFLADKLKTITRTQIKKIIISKKLSVNDRIISSPSQKVKIGDKIKFSILSLHLKRHSKLGSFENKSQPLPDKFFPEELGKRSNDNCAANDISAILKEFPTIHLLQQTIFDKFLQFLMSLSLLLLW